MATLDVYSKYKLVPFQLVVIFAFCMPQIIPIISHLLFHHCTTLCAVISLACSYSILLYICLAISISESGIFGVLGFWRISGFSDQLMLVSGGYMSCPLSDYK